MAENNDLQQQPQPQQELQQHDHANGNHHRHHHHHHRQQRHRHGNGEVPRRRTVLIAMDGSAHSFYAFDWFVSNAYRSHWDELLIGYAYQLPTYTFASVMATDPTIMSRLLEKEEEEVNVIVEKIKGKLTNTGVRGKLIRLTGEAGPAIVESANHHQVDFIVTGSRGLGTIRRTLVGSVSDYILHHAKCPVLVCRNKDKETNKT